MKTQHQNYLVWSRQVSSLHIIGLRLTRVYIKDKQAFIYHGATQSKNTNNLPNLESLRYILIQYDSSHKSKRTSFKYEFSRHWTVKGTKCLGHIFKFEYFLKTIFCRHNCSLNYFFQLILIILDQ